MRMGDLLKGGLAVTVLAAVASGCVSQSQYDAMVQKYHAKDAEALRLALLLEDAQRGPNYGDIMKKLIASGDLIQVGEGVALPGLGFGAGKHELTARGKAALDNVASQLKGQKVFVMVDGHTDADPIKRSKSKYTSNLHLSVMRAKAVAEYLIAQGVADTRVFVRGFGPNKPIAENKTTAGKKKNRRVEIYALESAPASPGKSAPTYRRGAPDAGLK